MRLIDADALKHSIAGNIPLMPTVRIAIEHRIDDMPTIEAKPVVHGRWVVIPDRPEWDQKQCSLCGDIRCCQGNYCPNCGAKMEG